MIDVDRIIQLTSEYDVITFDVFDTLIIRDVMKPTDLFAVSYGFIGRYVRVVSETISRLGVKNQETTFNRINQICPFSCDKELEDEKRLCRANPKISEVYRILKEQGKQMYAISDMYLPSDFIQELLNSAGYDLPVIVSCDEGISKKNGDLYKKFLKQYNFSSKDVIHIGDNMESDGDGARSAGIKSIIIDRHKNLLSYSRYSIKNSELISFINHGLNELSDPIESIGYEIIGPIILAFCQWVHKQYLELRFDRMFFLARDMRFSYEIYKALYPEDDVVYLRISRKSLQFASHNHDEICKYLINEKCYGNVSIVDTGWVGGMQIEIEKYCRMIDEDTDLGGLYLGSKLAFRRLIRSAKSKVCMYSNRYDQFKAQLIPPFMETLIGCNEPQVISYHDGLPVYDRKESRDNTIHIKSGAKKFIKDWKKIKGNKDVDIKIPKKAFERLFYFPQNKHILMIGDLHYEDYKDTKIVSFDDNCNYFIHPLKLLNDLSFSGWKGAFLKKTGFLYPILLGIYVLLGSLRLYILDLNNLKHN